MIVLPEVYGVSKLVKLILVHKGDGTLTDLDKARCPDPNCGGECVKEYAEDAGIHSYYWTGTWLCASCGEEFEGDLYVGRRWQ